MRGRKIIDLTGKVFGQLVVLKITPIKKWGAHWECLCSCGVNIIIRGDGLRKGTTKSCGCGKGHQSHNQTGTKEYSAWGSIKQRCYNQKNRFYSYYGGRGIIMSSRWLSSFENFLADMGRAPSKKHTLDRINNDGNYEPSNCRWATQAEQSVNKRCTKMVTYQGQLKPLATWCKELNLPRSTMYTRIVKQKWSIEKAFAT